MKRLLLALLLIPSLCFGAALDQSKIIAPLSGVYFGAYEWTAGDIAAVESATGEQPVEFNFRVLISLVFDESVTRSLCRGQINPALRSASGGVVA